MSLSPPWSKLVTHARIGETVIGQSFVFSHSFAKLPSKRPYCGRICYSTVAQASAQKQEHDATQDAAAPLGQLAKQKEEDKQFFADLLTSAATKRDARAYISRLKQPQTSPTSTRDATPKTPNFFGRSVAVETSPVFQQCLSNPEQALAELEMPHVALVKISGLDQIKDGILRGIVGTLAQLARLSMLPCVVIDSTATADAAIRRKVVTYQADRLVRMLEEVTERGGRKISDIFTIGSDGRPTLSMPNLLFRPLQRGRISVVVPIAYDDATQKATNINADEAVLALTQYMSQHNHQSGQRHEPGLNAPPERASVDRVIVIDQSGGIPSTKSIDQMHVFVNMAQEYHALQEELRSSTDPRVSPQHASNLAMLNRALEMLPASASGLITTPEEASNSRPRLQSDLQVSSVGTRRQRNPLIHSLITDKPAYSSSLPSTRFSTTSPAITSSTSVKRGMPLTILPNPAAQTWTPTKQPWIKLTDPRIDLPRLVHLINDSFDRTLDVDAYLRRVNDSIAGVIIAGDYEGGAILTWERPPYLPPTTERLVPYLDKFAVLKKAQGAGGVVDNVFNAMVRTCFPDGVCWRSRKDNPVNKWYFERSRGRGRFRI